MTSIYGLNFSFFCCKNIKYSFYFNGYYYSFVKDEKRRSKYLVLGPGVRRTFQSSSRTLRILFNVLSRTRLLITNAFLLLILSHYLIRITFLQQLIQLFLTKTARKRLFSTYCGLRESFSWKLCPHSIKSCQSFFISCIYLIFLLN